MASPEPMGSEAAREPAASVLDGIACAGRTRSLRSVEQLEGCRVRVDGQEALSFASCDYLGLARHPRLAAAAGRAATEAGTSSGSARLLAGHDERVAALERELAQAFDSPAALVFSSGYLANVGIVRALAGPGDLILSDRLSHASTIDACRLSGAEVRVFPHNDLVVLQQQLSDVVPGQRVLVLVEGVYSMDGDCAPLAEVVDLAERAGARVVVDDAHGLGAVGPDGRGACAAAGVSGRVAAQVGNLGKALGSFGGFVLTDVLTRELLVQTSRPFIYTCALPPTVVAAAREALLVRAEEPQRTERLAHNAALLRELLRSLGIPVADVRLPGSPIVPVCVGDDRRTVALADALLGRGFHVPAIRPLTVPEGSSRLRITLGANHTGADCRALATALAEVMAELPGEVHP